MNVGPRIAGRRAVLGGALAAGGLAAAATLLPGRPVTDPAPPVASGAVPPSDAQGYQLSEHVKRYYATARI